MEIVAKFIVEKKHFDALIKSLGCLRPLIVAFDGRYRSPKNGTRKQKLKKED